jgi:hypothetical protein
MASGGESGGESGDAPTTRGLKSAYEAALAKLDSQGIAPPDEGALSDTVREAIGEARRRGEAKLAELEILHHGKLRTLVDHAERAAREEEYRRDRERLASERDGKIERVRSGAGG